MPGEMKIEKMTDCSLRVMVGGVVCDGAAEYERRRGRVEGVMIEQESVRMRPAVLAASEDGIREKANRSTTLATGAPVIARVLLTTMLLTTMPVFARYVMTMTMSLFPSMPPRT